MNSQNIRIYPTATVSMYHCAFDLLARWSTWTVRLTGEVKSPNVRCTMGASDLGEKNAVLCCFHVRFGRGNYCAIINILIKYHFVIKQLDTSKIFYYDLYSFHLILPYLQKSLFKLIKSTPYILNFKINNQCRNYT